MRCQNWLSTNILRLISFHLIATLTTYCDDGLVPTQKTLLYWCTAWLDMDMDMERSRFSWELPALFKSCFHTNVDFFAEKLQQQQQL